MVYVHRKLCIRTLDAHNRKKSLAVKEIAFKLKVYDTATKLVHLPYITQK